MTLAAARKVVAAKSDRVIERETATKWAEYAIVCWERAATAHDPLPWLLRAESYKHEALEHAATVGDMGRTLRKIEKRLDRAERAGHSVRRMKRKR